MTAPGDLGSYDISNTPPQTDGVGMVTSELAKVESQDIAGALTTASLSPAAQARLKGRAGNCPLNLAWVMVSSATGKPMETIRLISGSYYSPIFKLSEAPVKIAIPYPAPYRTGHGTLTVLHTGGSAMVALRPAWHLSAQDTSTTHEVTWHPEKGCAPPNG